MVYNPVFVYTGSFNPIHNGHIEVGHQAQKSHESLGYLGAARILFVPVSTSILGKPPFSLYHRTEMVRLALQGEAGMQVQNLDEGLDQSRTNYARLQSLNEMGINPNFWIIGSDCYTSETFKRLEFEKVVASGVVLAVVDRLGFPIKDKRKGADGAEIEIPKDDLEQRVRLIGESQKHRGITSGSVRGRLQRGEDCSKMLPGKVLEYITQNQLYCDAVIAA